MKTLLPIVSWLALAVLLGAALAYLGGGITLPATKLAMLVATLVWFATTPFWMGRERR